MPRPAGHSTGQSVRQGQGKMKRTVNRPGGNLIEDLSKVCTPVVDVTVDDFPFGIRSGVIGLWNWRHGTLVCAGDLGV